MDLRTEVGLAVNTLEAPLACALKLGAAPVALAAVEARLAEAWVVHKARLGVVAWELAVGAREAWRAFAGVVYAVL